MVYQVLGKLLWKGGLGKAEVVILHRGAPGNKKIIFGRDISEVKRSYFVYRNQAGEETTIPIHRILEVRHEGKQVWKRAGKA
jgi:uncharacterized protein (UPF0248 family)